MRRCPKILYAGDGDAHGPARYLLAILHSAGIKTVHVPPGRRIIESALQSPFDAYIFSDYSQRDLSAACERVIAEQVRAGAGLLMVGGWGSFSGPFGNWQGSKIERLLPVTCLKKDDRRQFSSGLWLKPLVKHPLIASLPWDPPPVICGINKVQVRKTSRVILSAQALIKKDSSTAGFSESHPLLVVDGKAQNRRAAFLTDFAPHWAAGFLDWGPAVRVRDSEFGEVQVGKYYLQFGISLVRWLAGA